MKRYGTLILLAIGWIVPLLFFNKDSFGIKYPTNVDMLLNNKTKRSHSGWCLAEVLVFLGDIQCFLFSVFINDDLWRLLQVLYGAMTETSCRICHLLTRIYSTSFQYWALRPIQIYFFPDLFLNRLFLIYSFFTSSVVTRLFRFSLLIQT